MVPCSKKIQRQMFKLRSLPAGAAMWFNKPNTFWLHIFTEAALLKYITYEMFEINLSHFGKDSPFFNANAATFRLLYSLFEPVHWGDLTHDITAAFQPVNFFKCIRNCVEFCLFLCPSICPLCVVNSLWVAGQSYNSHSVSWSSPISKLPCPHSCGSLVSVSFWSA